MEVKKLLEVLTTAEHLKDVQGTVILQEEGVRVLRNIHGG